MSHNDDSFDSGCSLCDEPAGASGLCRSCKMRDRADRKPSKHERNLMKQRRKINRDLGGNAKGFFAAAS